MKRLLAFLLLLFIMLSLASCTGELRPEPIDAADVGHITATTAIYSNYMYVVEDDEAIAELVGLYNDLRYVPTDEVSFADLLGDTLYSITYQSRSPDSERPLANVLISPRGYVHFTDYEAEDDPDAELPVYRLTNAFDEERLNEILNTYDVMK